MAFTIPDKGEGDSNIQSILFQEYLDVLVAGIQGIDYVYNGCGVTGGADMTPAVAAGVVVTNGIVKLVAAADVTIGTADATNPRIDLIVVDSSGAKAVRAGTAAAAPKPPAKTANDVVLASVYVPANDTTIASTQITDLRMVRNYQPLCIALASDATAANGATGVEISGLSVTLEAGTYVANWYINYTNATTTTGVSFGVNYTGTATFSVGWMRYASTGTTAATGATSMVATAATGNLHESMGFRAESTTSPNMGALVSSDASANNLMIIEALIKVSDAGDLELWYSGDAATNITAVAGSSLVLLRTG